MPTTAIVRIAPVEHWCDNYKECLDDQPELLRLPGVEIEIELASCETTTEDHDAPVNRWRVTERSKAEVSYLLGESSPDESGWHICRCMLEMD
jgi:hypothetical protein